MFDPSVIFQRTHEGRAEIKQKSHGLTQSERLVLIMVDGVSTYQAVRDKLPALTDDRFNRAVRKLHQKELILEVFMPTEEAEAEHLEQDVIERFLYQDALDPVTIIMFDPEDELAGISAPAASHYKKPGDQPPVAPDVITPSIAQPVGETVAEPAPLPEVPLVTLPAAHDAMPATAPAPVSVEREGRAEPVVALDEAHIEMVDLLGQEVRQRQLERSPRVVERNEVAPPQFHFPPPKPVARKDSLMHMHWGYWMMGVGAACIAGYFLF